MPQIITVGSELIQINSAKNHIECSKDNGRSWTPRLTASSYGTFIDLLLFGSDIIAATSKGVYASTTEGRSWTPRYIGSTYGSFLSLSINGNELLAKTTNGLYASKNGGRSWIKRM